MENDLKYLCVAQIWEFDICHFFAFLHPHLGLLLLCGVDDGGAAHLSQLAALSVKGPAADLVPDHVFDEEDSATVAEGQPVEQLNVL